MNLKSNYRNAVARLGVVTVLSTTALSAVFALGGPKGANMKVSAAVEQPKIIAVRIRHDMCPLCKQLDPKFPEIVREFGDASVLFLTLDLTNETTQQQAALLTGALGLNAVWTGDLSKLGSVTFMDGNTKETVSYVQTVDTEVIRSELRNAIDTRG